YERLEQIGLHSTNALHLMMNFFAAAGFNPTPPKSVYFNDRESTLTVRATPDDLNQIEQHLAKISPQASATVSGSNGIAHPTQQEMTTATMLQDAKLLFEQGKLDESWEILQKILSIQPDNQAALAYAALIKQAHAGKAADGTQGSAPPQN